MAWFLCLYKLRSVFTNRRYCAMDDFTAQILADGGDWRETEVLGNTAIVKVRASAATLSAINAAPGFARIPVDRLDDPLSSLTSTQLSAIKNKVLALGYTQPELTDALGSDLSLITLGQLLRFIATRRLKPRYDVVTDTIVLDGPIQPCLPIEQVDGVVN